ncbi:stAR-related lipid transfer protein 6-like isoform X1 [Acipenser oxyrinchus oxyrinchus]|uniref:StAR-related lipid transfer protein 6-like isoform X1 n=1 Tax=Acipenser oxyrinchus oxyrinchus TaxID=40147 RepID=A0AAD8LVQ6_ACIOX|nr:stAR-related lipid transfer protein 6-like isoform X1 [Acipenser oxyrinchus oxyrinchus]
MDYLQIADEVAQKIWSYNQDDSGWKLAKNSVRIRHYLQWNFEILDRYRGEGIIEDTPEKIIPFMYLPEYRNKWDTAVKSYIFLERIDQDTVIFHTITHSYGLGLISSRDFVDLINVKRYEGGIVTTNSASVDYLKCPPSPSHVRGHNNPCEYICSPLPETPGHSKLVVFIQPDLGGKLPRSVVEFAIPNNIVNLINDTRTGIKAMC